MARVMATVTAVAVQRSGPAIRAALTEHAPEDCGRFEAELRAALAGAVGDLDLSTVEAVLVRWHALATMAVNPLAPEERAQLQRAKAGDFTGLYSRDESGNWVRLANVTPSTTSTPTNGVSHSTTTGSCSIAGNVRDGRWGPWTCAGSSLYIDH